MPTDDHRRRPPPDLTRGSGRVPRGRARRLVERSSAADRDARFAERLDHVRAQQERRAQRRRYGRRIAVAGAVLLCVAVGTALGSVVTETGSDGALQGAGLGLLAGGALVGLGFAAIRLAEGRGARAWDWRAQRYRIWGDPSARVQSMDRPPDERPDGLFDT